MLYLIFKLYPFTLLKQSRSFTFLFMFLGELLHYYQSSNNLPQSVQTLDFDLKSCFVFLNTSSRSTRCWLASVSLFVVLVCLGPWLCLNLCWFGSQSLLGRARGLVYRLFVYKAYIHSRIYYLASIEHLKLYSQKYSWLLICIWKSFTQVPITTRASQA